jgi:CRP-like cAMP-binding protein
MSAEDLLSRDIPLFQGLVPADLAGMDLQLAERRLRPWELLFNQQDGGTDVHFLLSGELVALYWTPEGREVIFSRIGPGSYIGEIAALDEGSRSLAVVARGGATLVSLPGVVFRSLFDRLPLVRWRVTRDLVARIRGLTARHLELATCSVEERVGSYIMRLALDRGQMCPGGIIQAAPTHADIAASIGSNREMVSRSLKVLASKGIVRVGRRQIVLLDPDRLSDRP